MEIMQILLDAGADVNAPAGDFDTALQAATCDGREEMV